MILWSLILWTRLQREYYIYPRVVDIQEKVKKLSHFPNFMTFMISMEMCWCVAHFTLDRHRLWAHRFNTVNTRSCLLAKRNQDLNFPQTLSRPLHKPPLETYSLKQCESQSWQKHFPLYVHFKQAILFLFPTEKQTKLSLATCAYPPWGYFWRSTWIYQVPVIFRYPLTLPSIIPPFFKVYSRFVLVIHLINRIKLILANYNKTDIVVLRKSCCSTYYWP